MILVPEAVLDVGALLIAVGLMPKGRLEVAVASSLAADAVLDQLLEFGVPGCDDPEAAQFLALDLMGAAHQWIPTAGMVEPIAQLMAEHPELEAAQAATVALAQLARLPIITANPSLPAGSVSLIVVR